MSTTVEHFGRVVLLPDPDELTAEDVDRAFAEDEADEWFNDRHYVPVSREGLRELAERVGDAAKSYARCHHAAADTVRRWITAHPTGMNATDWAAARAEEDEAYMRAELARQHMLRLITEWQQ